MNNSTSYLAYVTAQTLAVISSFLPRLLAALILLGLGILLAKLVRQLLSRILQATNLSQLLNKTPLQLAFENQNVGEYITRFIVGAIYWLLILLAIHASSTVLGLISVTLILEKVLNYVPQILSALVVLGFGMLLAGLVESVVKGAARGIGVHNAILLGKVASYAVVTIAALSSLSELGIAKEFINILFIGFVSSLSLAAALALGLGSKDTVHRLLSSWYERNFTKEVESDKPQSKKRGS